MKKRIVCWFSCGAASAVATKLAIQEYKDSHEIVVARCVVREEHPDNDRFAAKCEKWFGVPILNLIADEYDGSIFKVIQARKYISGIKGAPCTLLLKKQVRIDFQKPGDRHIFGYTSDEIDRFDRFLDANNIEVDAPLIERGIDHANCLAIVQDAGIELPVMYKLGFKHNNCIGCVKSTGAGYWNKIKTHFPNQFWMMAGASRALGVRMIRIEEERVFLDELPENVGNYNDEPEIQCGIFCELAKQEIAGD